MRQGEHKMSLEHPAVLGSKEVCSKGMRADQKDTGANLKELPMAKAEIIVKIK